eukprot:15462179-Alexandrium_andersonii.AAC.1
MNWELALFSRDWASTKCCPKLGRPTGPRQAMNKARNTMNLFLNLVRRPRKLPRNSAHLKQ